MPIKNAGSQPYCCYDCEACEVERGITFFAGGSKAFLTGGSKASQMRRSALLLLLPPASPPSSPSPDQPRAQSRLAALLPPNGGQDVRRFDGIWITKLVCDAAPAGVLSVTLNFIGRVKDGVFHGETGEKDKPGFASVDGTIEPGGSAAFVWSGLSSDPKRTLNHMAEGTKYSWTLAGKFENANGSAIEYQGKTCNIAFAKR
jgi:hypothetical protein